MAAYDRHPDSQRLGNMVLTILICVERLPFLVAQAKDQ